MASGPEKNCSRLDRVGKKGNNCGTESIWPGGSGRSEKRNICYKLINYNIFKLTKQQFVILAPIHSKSLLCRVVLGGLCAVNCATDAVTQNTVAVSTLLWSEIAHFTA